MTGSGAANPGGAPRRSAAWSAVFRLSYRVIRALDPLIRSWIANGLPGLGGIVEVRTIGRRTGRPRRTLLTLLRVDDRWYVGHPNGEAAWMRNAEAAGWLDVEPAGPGGPRHRLVRLPDGAERDAVVRATWTQQPFPADVLYRAARRHVAAVGVYHRLEPLPGGRAWGSSAGAGARDEPEGAR
ncbi:MAG TPA: nitroreductase/quinone reductase family protein [Candidatus Limnocylindrales bacterium]|nr:nitroreductase/quinone reductase family protein [Candidatus Limnocylindrales bacterium]